MERLIEDIHSEQEETRRLLAQDVGTTRFVYFIVCEYMRVWASLKKYQFVFFQPGWLRNVFIIVRLLAQDVGTTRFVYFIVCEYMRVWASLNK